jgi:hypothetical protein
MIKTEMKLNTYKFRAEILADVIAFMNYAPKGRNKILIRYIEIVTDEYSMDCYVTLKTTSEMSKVLDKIIDVERKKGDVHVIFETLQPEKEYTGERIRSIRDRVDYD